MADCLISQPAGFNSTIPHSYSSHWQPMHSPSINTSSSSFAEYLHLYPNHSNSHSSTWTSHKTVPLWLQYLSKLLSDPLKPPPSSTRRSSCAVLRIRHTTSSSVISSPLTVSESKSSSFKRTIKHFHRIHKRNIMAPSRSPRQPSSSFHMKTRSRAAKSSESSSPDTPSQPVSAQSSSNPRKRKALGDDNDKSHTAQGTESTSPDTSSLPTSVQSSSNPKKLKTLDDGDDKSATTNGTELSSPDAASSPFSAQSLSNPQKVDASDGANNKSGTSKGTDSNSPIPSSPPTSAQTLISSHPSSNLRKRKVLDDDNSKSQAPPKPKGQPRPRKPVPYDKDRELWPEFNPNKKVYYRIDGLTRGPAPPKPKKTKIQPLPTQDLSTDTEPEPEPVDAEQDSASPSRSPKKSARGGSNRGRGGFSGNAGGRKSNKQKGKNGGAGGGRDSPDPPNRKGPLTQDDRVEISMLKARQHELKKLFSVIGTQQFDILDKLATKDLSKLARKPKAYKHVPEFDQVTEALDALKDQVEQDIKTRYNIQLEHEIQYLEQEKEVLEQKYRTRVNEAKKEHLAGAQGDIILFERAYRAAHDDTHTETGSDMDYFPHYHECPEPDAQPRGYVSGQIMDEKPFMKALETYDDQARQQVLEEDVIHPLLKQIEDRNNEWREDEFRKKTMNMDALSAEATKELENIKGYLVARPFDTRESNSYALSALADVAEWTARKHPENYYIYMPLAPGETFPREALDFSRLPGTQPYPPLRPASTNFKPATNGAVAPPPPPPPASAASARLVSSGPGQPIAPAPPKPAARPSMGHNIFRQSRLGSQSGQGQSNGGQQFIFQTPQQPFQHQAAPAPTPTPQYGPAGPAGGSNTPVGQQTKIPMTFVNQTIESRNAAAAGAGSVAAGGAGANAAAANIKGGQRMLLPKVQR